MRQKGQPSFDVTDWPPKELATWPGHGGVSTQARESLLSLNGWDQGQSWQVTARLGPLIQKLGEWASGYYPSYSSGFLLEQQELASPSPRSRADEIIMLGSPPAAGGPVGLPPTREDGFHHHVPIRLCSEGTCRPFLPHLLSLIMS